MKFHFSAIVCACLIAGCGGGSGDSGGLDTGAGGGGGVVRPEARLDRMNIDTGGKPIVDEPKTDANLTVSRNDVVSFKGPIAIEFRGDHSQRHPKKSYGFETRDAANEDIDVSILGFPEEEDWILYAPYSDKSLIRNVLIYGLSRDIGRYASRTWFVEPVINGSYEGVYVFMEKLKRNANRIDINKLREGENSGEGVTGGYILKLDRIDDTDDVARGSFASDYLPNGATKGQSIRFLYDEPDADDITAEQKAYIKSYVSNFENSLRSTTGSQPNYQDFIDVDSFVDFFILTELANNVDGYRLSTWITKDKNEKLKMGPIWDFNLAFGNANYCGGGEPDVWAYRFNERCPDSIRLVPFWWDSLMKSPAFQARLKQRWSELRGSAFAETAIRQKINDYSRTLSSAGAVDANFARWPVLRAVHFSLTPV